MYIIYIYISQSHTSPDTSLSPQILENLSLVASAILQEQGHVRVYYVYYVHYGHMYSTLYSLFITTVGHIISAI